MITQRISYLLYFNKPATHVQIHRNLKLTKFCTIHITFYCINAFLNALNASLHLTAFLPHSECTAFFPSSSWPLSFLSLFLSFSSSSNLAWFMRECLSGVYRAFVHLDTLSCIHGVPLSNSYLLYFNPLLHSSYKSVRMAKISNLKYEGIIKKIIWASLLWVGRRWETILGCLSKADEKKNSCNKGLTGLLLQYTVSSNNCQVVPLVNVEFQRIIKSFAYIVFWINEFLTRTEIFFRKIYQIGDLAVLFIPIGLWANFVTQNC